MSTEFNANSKGILKKNPDELADIHMQIQFWTDSEKKAQKLNHNLLISQCRKHQVDAMLKCQLIKTELPDSDLKLEFTHFKEWSD